MARVVLDDEAWEVVRAAYEDTDEAVHRIALRFGIDRRRIFDRAARFGWRMRSERTVRRLADVPPRVIEPPRPRAAAVRPNENCADTDKNCSSAMPVDPDRPAESHGQRLERLHRIIDRLLARLESTMDHNMTPQDQEKAARAISQTVAAVERVTELANAQGKVPETDGGQSHDRAEAERMRREIAERLERLSAKWLDGTAKPE
ncbi:MAG: hypothetical protein MUC37_11985 [Hyphomicrobium sp.]|nr:hypothetical protein [Hyphomicrobium sp.]